MTRRTFALVLATLALLAGCGHHIPDPAPVQTVQTVQPAAVSTSYTSVAAILRNTGTGWTILSNTTHQPMHITSVTDMGAYLRVHFDQTFTKVASVTVSPDETFAGKYDAGASVGLSYMNVYLTDHDGTPVTPATLTSPSGNFWITGTMWTN